MSSKPKSIDLARLANDKNGEARAMLKELEGASKTERLRIPRWPARFASLGGSKKRSLGATISRHDPLRGQGAFMKTKSISIDLAGLANNKTGEARAMLEELEGTPKVTRLSEALWPTRFISLSEPKERSIRRND